MASWRTSLTGFMNVHIPQTQALIKWSKTRVIIIYIVLIWSRIFLVMLKLKVFFYYVLDHYRLLEPCLVCDLLDRLKSLNNDITE